MTMIEYDKQEYETLESQEMSEELAFKLVQFTTGFYGIISYNPTSPEKETVILVSPEDKETPSIFRSLGCESFMVFARDAKKYLENVPTELVVYLGTDAAEEYREVITRDQEKTLFEKVQICLEIMEMRVENSFHYGYGDHILTIMLCLNVFVIVFVIINALQTLGGI